jgi:glucose-6-phosphate 1-dehydrogenase
VARGHGGLRAGASRRDGGDATLFAREDYVEEAWRIVDLVIKADTPVYEHEPGTWGPPQVAERIVPPDGWHDPVMNTATDGRDVHAA